MEFKVLLKNKKESDSEWIERLETELNYFYKEIKHDSASWDMKLVFIIKGLCIS